MVFIRFWFFVVSRLVRIRNLRYERGAIPGRKCLIDNVRPVRNCVIMAQKAQKAQKWLSSEPPVFGDGLKRGGVAVTVCFWTRGLLLWFVVQSRLLEFLAQFRGDTKKFVGRNASEPSII